MYGLLSLHTTDLPLVSNCSVSYTHTLHYTYIHTVVGKDMLKQG